MKKLLYGALALVMASCGGATSENAAPTDTVAPVDPNTLIAPDSMLSRGLAAVSSGDFDAYRAFAYNAGAEAPDSAELRASLARYKGMEYRVDSVARRADTAVVYVSLDLAGHRHPAALKCVRGADSIWRYPLDPAFPKPRLRRR